MLAFDPHLSCVYEACELGNAECFFITLYYTHGFQNRAKSLCAGYIGFAVCYYLLLMVYTLNALEGGV